MELMMMGVAGRYGFPAWYGPGRTPYDPGKGEREVSQMKEVFLFIGELKSHLITASLIPQRPTLYVDPFLSEYELSSEDDSPSMPQALSTLSALNSSISTLVRVISPLSPGWNEANGIRDNLEGAGCGQVIWRIGEGVGDFEGACSV